MNFDTIYGLLKEFPGNSQNSSTAFLALLLTLHFSDIKVSCFDYIPTNEHEKKENERAHKILYGIQQNITMNDLHWASAQRVSGDGRIADEIKQILSKTYQGKKYVIIGGPAHVQISIALKIDSLNIMPDGLYQNLLLGSHANVIQNLCSSNVISFAYKENSITQVYWDDKIQRMDKLKQPFSYSSNPQFGSPITVSGDLCNKMVNEIKKINGIDPTDLEKYLAFVSQNQYGKALRTACNSCKSIDNDKGVYELIKIILNYMEKLSININENNSENKTAIYYAALKGNQEVYDLLVANGAIVSNEKSILEESLKKLAEKKPTVSPQTK